MQEEEKILKNKKRHLIIRITKEGRREAKNIDVYVGRTRENEWSDR